MIDPESAVVFCRGIIFGAILMIWGAALFRSRLLPAQRKFYEDWMLGALVVAVAALLPAQVARVMDDWSVAFDLDTTRLVIKATTPGLSWAVQALGAVVLVAGFVKRRDWIVIAGGLFVMNGFSLTGHAAASDGIPGYLRQANNVLHLVAAGAWLGALPYVLSLLPRLYEPDVRAVLIRYSGEGHFWVSVVLLTGLIATLWIFGGIPYDLTVQYQLLWTAKVAATLTMVGLAIYNRYHLLPRLKEGPAALAALARATRMEIILGLVVVALVAWFGMMEPR